MTTTDTSQTASPAPLAPSRQPMRYRWLMVLMGLAVVVAILLVYAQNTVYQPTTPFVGGSGDHVHAFALDPRAPKHLYVGTHYGFFRTNDGGAHWARLNDQGGIPGTLVATSVSLSPIDGQTVYTTGYLLGDGNAAGVFVTRDDGAHWAALPNGGARQLPDPRILFVAAGWSQPDEAYAYSIDTGLYRTADAGAHWDHVAPPFAGQVTAFVPYLDCGGQAGATDCPERVLIGTTQGLLRGDLGGATPTFAPVAGITGYCYALAVARDATPTPTLTVSTAQGLFQARGGTAPFTALSSVADGAPIFTSLVAFNGSVTLFGVTRDNAVQRSADGGKTWQPVGTRQFTRNISQLQSGLRAATGSNTPQWAGGQNIFATLLQAPATAGSQQIFVAISFPVQLFQGTMAGSGWQDLSKV